jgi:hypothetical protein
MELGARRNQYKRRIQEALDNNNIPSYVELGRKLGVTSVAVSRTINGELHCSKVLDWLREHGVPEYQLCDPRTVRDDLAI